MNQTYLYAIGTTGFLQKIGYSIHPEKRLKKLQTGNPDVLILHYKFEIDTEKARLFEQNFHKQYNYKRLRGEWFKMSVEEVIGLMKFQEIMSETIINSL